MARKKDEDDEDDFDNPYDFFKFFSDPNNLFKSKRMQKLFKDIFDQVMRNLPPEFNGLDPEELRKEIFRNKSKLGIKGPFVYGFNITIGPDGKPTIDSFGTLKPKVEEGETSIRETREPLVEVNEDKDHVIVIAEMPGITKEDIEIKATSRSLTISAKSEEFGRNYYKEIDLPAAINSNKAKARYQNGILEITLEKVKEEQTDISIE
ncbi:MAG: archaeal heat shock protein Hsp20 [Promethearchaeia archaeon]